MMLARLACMIFAHKVLEGPLLTRSIIPIFNFCMTRSLMLASVKNFLKRKRRLIQSNKKCRGSLFRKILLFRWKKEYVLLRYIIIPHYAAPGKAISGEKEGAEQD